MIKHSYTSRLWITSAPAASAISAPMVNSDQEHKLQAGWALKSKHEVKRFSSDMRVWVKAHFINGERIGKKLLGEEMNRLQRTSFPVDEWKTAIQFKSLLYRLSSEYRETGFEVDDDTDIGGSIQDYEEAVEEAAKLNGILADLQVNGYVAVHLWCLLGMAT